MLGSSLRAVGVMLQRIPRRWAWIPVVIWMGEIFHLSSQPAPEWGGPGSVASVLRNSAHAVEYGVLALWSALLFRRELGWPVIDRRSCITLLVLILLYAVSDEWHQYFTPHRDASACDVLTDVTGAALTLCAIGYAGGRRASDRKLAWTFVFGIPAVVLCGAIASYVPRFFPNVPGL